MARAAADAGARTAQQQAAAAAGADLSVSQAAANQAESAFGARNADPMAVRRNSTAIISDGAITDNDDAAVEALERARITLRTLRTVADGLGGIPGRRKAILYFSEGLPVTPRAADLVAELTRVTAAAARANVTIYTFDPRGLDLHMGAELLATGVSPSTQLQQKRRLSAEMLRSLAAETGGAAAIETNDPRRRPRARRQREQPLLPDRLRAHRRGARRALSVDRRAREAAGPARQRPQGLRRARRPRAAAAQLLGARPGAVRAGAPADVDARPAARR